MNLLRATVELTHRNTRRYGGYLVHMGIVLMFIGFTGHAFNQNEVKELNNGDTMQVGHYKLRMVNLAAGRKRQLPVAPRHHAGFQERRGSGHAGAGEALLQGQPRGHFRSRHPAAAQRGSVPEFRRHVGRQPARRDSGLRFPAGLVDLDRRAGADRRHAGLPGSEQDQDAVRPHGSGGASPRNMQRFKSSLLDCQSLALVAAAAVGRRPPAEKPSADVRRVGCGCSASAAARIRWPPAACWSAASPSRPRSASRACRRSACRTSQIIDAFMRDYGPEIYLAPPSAFGWMVPYASVGFGLVVIWLFVQEVPQAASR